MQLSQLFIKHPDHMCVISSDRHWEIFLLSLKSCAVKHCWFLCLAMGGSSGFLACCSGLITVVRGEWTAHVQPRVPHGPQVVVILVLKLNQKSPEECSNIFPFCPLLSSFFFFPLGLPKMCLSCCPCLWSSLEFCVALDSEKKKKKRKIPHMAKVMGVRHLGLCRTVLRRELGDTIYFKICIFIATTHLLWWFFFFLKIFSSTEGREWGLEATSNI